jgi:hypothetical protein
MEGNYWTELWKTAELKWAKKSHWSDLGRTDFPEVKLLESFAKNLLE